MKISYDPELVEQNRKGRPEGLPFIDPRFVAGVPYLPGFAGAEMGAVLVPDRTECDPVVRS